MGAYEQPEQMLCPFEDRVVRSIQQVALVVEVDASKSVRVTRDKNDDPVIETAVLAKANYLCSIDKDIGATEVLDHCKAVGVEVVSDTTLIAILRNPGTS
jgi:predicted nucleic acid-binding protein